MRAVRIGLTGPIGCGKSTVAGWLASQPGIATIDADRVARDVLAPGTPELAAVLDRFGADLAAPDGTLDRAALGRIVFADPAALRDLEAIVHPAIRPRILAAMEAADRVAARAVVVEAIKLVEGGLAALCDEVWFVTCEPETQRERLEGRGMSGRDADDRVAAQAGLPGVAARVATHTLATDGSLEDTADRAAALLAAALATGGVPRDGRRSPRRAFDERTL